MTYLLEGRLSGILTTKMIDVVLAEDLYSFVFNKTISFSKRDEEEFREHINTEVECWHDILLTLEGTPFKKIHTKPTSVYLMPVSVELAYDGMSGQEIVEAGFDDAYVTMAESISELYGKRLVDLKKSSNYSYHLSAVDVLYQADDEADKEQMMLSKSDQTILLFALTNLLGLGV